MPETNCGFLDNQNGASGASLLSTYGPTLRVDIGFDSEWKPAVPNIAPKSILQNLEALVDTGAAECCIDSFLASQLNLPIVDRRIIAGAGGKHEVNVYLAQVHVPALKHTIYGAFAGVDLQAGGQVHKALIGRTFLQHFTMQYFGKTGSVILSS